MVSEVLDRQASRPRVLAVAAGMLLVLATTLGLPQLHATFHAPGAPEAECPVHFLQTAFSLVLVGIVALPLLRTRYSPPAIPQLASAPRAARRTPAAPRSPPHHSFHSS